MVGRESVFLAGRVDFGIDRLIEVAVLQLVLWVDELLGASGCGIESVVVVMVGLRRGWILRHLGEHPVLDSRVRVSAVALTKGREVVVGHHSRGHDGRIKGWSSWGEEQQLPSGSGGRGGGGK